MSTQSGAQTDSDRRWLAGILLLGAGLRLYAIWFGLPYLRARPDEIDAVMHGQMVMRGDLNPHFFHWPSLTFYTFGAVFTAVSDVLGALTPGAAVSDAQYLVLARIVVALAGTATIAVLYDLARRIADAWTGIAAATFLAVAILHVRESHFAMTDVLMTLLATASLALLARAVDAAEADVANTDPLRWFAASGLVGGLAASTKYNAAAVVVAMAAVQLVWLVRSRGKAATPAHVAPGADFRRRLRLRILCRDAVRGHRLAHVPRRSAVSTLGTWPPATATTSGAAGRITSRGRSLTASVSRRAWPRWRASSRW